MLILFLLFDTSPNPKSFFGVLLSNKRNKKMKSICSTFHPEREFIMNTEFIISSYFHIISELLHKQTTSLAELILCTRQAFLTFEKTTQAPKNSKLKQNPEKTQAKFLTNFKNRHFLRGKI